MTTLTEDELDVVFERFTQENQVADIDAYLAEGAAARAEAEKKAAEARAKESPKASEQPKAAPSKEGPQVKICLLYTSRCV